MAIAGVDMMGKSTLFGYPFLVFGVLRFLWLFGGEVLFCFDVC